MRLTRRRLLRQILSGSTLLPLIVACGQPVPTQTAVRVGGTVPLAATPSPDGTSATPATLGTPGTSAIPPDSPLTATAVALVPTMPGPKVPAPTGTQVFLTPTPHPPFPTVAQPQTLPTPRPEDPYRLGVSGHRPREIAQLVREAEIAIVGSVVTIFPAQWSTTDGQRPANPHQSPPGTHHFIYRPVQARVDQTLFGQVGSSEVYVLAYGGEIGQDYVCFLSETTFQFTDDERVVLLLKRPDAFVPASWQGQTLWMLVEHYTVSADGQAKADHRTIPLQQLLDEITSART